MCHVQSNINVMCVFSVISIQYPNLTIELEIEKFLNFMLLYTLM